MEAIGATPDEAPFVYDRMQAYGQLIVDASCTPADICYPTDLSLLNEAREQTERIIDLLYAQVREQVAQKPRTYRHEARQQPKMLRKAVR